MVSFDEEDRALAGSPECWHIIEGRRKGPEIPLAELKKRVKLSRRSRKLPRAAHGERKKPQEPMNVSSRTDLLPA